MLQLANWDIAGLVALKWVPSPKFSDILEPLTTFHGCVMPRILNTQLSDLSLVELVYLRNSLMLSQFITHTHRAMNPNVL